ncbi:hypothetical protein THAOC_23371, partial [Thalassiosira oceanica]
SDASTDSSSDTSSDEESYEAPDEESDACSDNWQGESCGVGESACLPERRGASDPRCRQADVIPTISN